ncbi:MAG: CPBP family intramembrane metalloprotease [Muribaculum sp.]|nr:CPBP family intramembrane metalloprotease [Muribaculum sp.]
MKKFIDICQFSLVLFGLMICGLFLTSVLSLIPFGNEKLMQWTIFSGQNVLAFMLPAMLAWRICFRQSAINAIDMDKAPSVKMLIFAFIVYAAAIPALNQVVFWNQEIHLPEMLAPFEDWCREMERLAEQQTEGLLNDTNIWHTLVNILIIGVLTGIGEEFFFRGALQKMLVRCKVNPHAAIWTAAIIFSILHFQFFGFVPRVLLGAWFGYLYWWSGCIWVNSFAHALNNSLVIVSAWCINKGFLSEKFDLLGVSTDSFPFLALLSACVVVVLICGISKLKIQNSKLSGDAS